MESKKFRRAVFLIALVLIVDINSFVLKNDYYDQENEGYRNYDRREIVGNGVYRLARLFGRPTSRPPYRPPSGGGSTSKRQQPIPQSCLDVFKATAIQQTNYYRQLHHANPLGQNDQFATDTATNYAQKLSNTFSFGHNPALFDINLGENLYQTIAQVPFTFSDSECRTFAMNAINTWYNEVSSYDFNSAQSIDGKMIGHFTQLVWKGTTNVGFGLAVNLNPDSAGRYYLTVAADYSPPGNWQGDFQNNVVPA